MINGRFGAVDTEKLQNCGHELRDRIHLLEKVVIGLLFLAAVNLLIVLVTGGYRVNLGLVRIAAYHLNGPLLLFLILAMATIMFRARRRGIPASSSLRSPLLLFLGVVFIYSLNGRASHGRRYDPSELSAAEPLARVRFRPR